MRVVTNFLFVFQLMVFTIAGCSSLGVEPWERDVLAK